MRTRYQVPDSTVAFLRQGYAFISSRCDRLGTDVFAARLALQPVVCMRGDEAARLFYDPQRFARQGAAPTPVQKTLFGQGGVQGLDGAAHRHRKQMFMSLMSAERIAALVELTTQHWRRAVSDWQDRGSVRLYNEAGRVLCAAVCAWAGVPLPEGEVDRRTADFHAMIEGAGTLGRRHWQGRAARRRAERWAGALIDAVRAGTLDVPRECALSVIAAHRDDEDRLLDRRVAAVELLNVLRPTVAIDRFIVFAALALQEHPEWRRRLTATVDPGETNSGETEMFVQEVRRFYPFFPAAVARVRTDFTWRQVRFRQGQRVLLDLYGTNRHPDLWPRPDVFDPERFRDRQPDAYAFIPQGGGSHDQDHRCAGEWITVALMSTAVNELTGGMRYDVPRQDLRVRLRRMPALPADGLLITNVHRVGS